MRETREEKAARKRKIRLDRLKVVVGRRPVFTNSGAALDLGQPIDNAKRRCSAARATGYEMHPDTAKELGLEVAGDITEQRKAEATPKHGTDEAKAAAEAADEKKNPGRRAAKEARAAAAKAEADASETKGAADAGAPQAPETDPGAPPSGVEVEVNVEVE